MATTPPPARPPAHPPGPAAAPPPAESDDLPAPDTPDTTSSPAPTRCRDIRSSACASGRFAAEEERRVLLLERGQPAVRGTGHRSRPRPRTVGGRQDLRWRDVAAGRRHEQLCHRPSQAQRPGQQHRGVLVGGAVDAPLQVADRPRGHARRRRQLLLGQLRLGPQPPQQPGKRKRRLLSHHRSAPTQPVRHGYRRRADQSCPPTVRRPSRSGHSPPLQIGPHSAVSGHRDPALPEPTAESHKEQPARARADSGQSSPEPGVRILVGCFVGCFVGGRAW